MKEIWTDVLDGRYQVSNAGQVRNSKGHILNKFRVNIQNKGIDRSFNTLEEAIGYRNEVMA